MCTKCYFLSHIESIGEPCHSELYHIHLFVASVRTVRGPVVYWALSQAEVHWWEHETLALKRWPWPSLNSFLLTLVSIRITWGLINRFLGSTTEFPGDSDAGFGGPILIICVLKCPSKVAQSIFYFYFFCWWCHGDCPGTVCCLGSLANHWGSPQQPPPTPHTLPATANWRIAKVQCFWLGNVIAIER